MKWIGFFSIVFLLIALSLFLIIKSKNIISPLVSKKEVKEKPLQQYTFQSLMKRKFEPSPITLGSVVKEDTEVISQMFYFTVDGKKVSGLANIPAERGEYPIIVMFRGYVPRSAFFSGNGTQRAGEVFARNGYITLAPDFLGFGESDATSNLAFEDRFQTYTTALELLSSLSLLNSGLSASYSGILSTPERVGIWGHSNGGHISLSVLSITGKSYPTVLWNPVSKPFPFSILFYTDEYDDHGKSLRKALADFEKEYDVEEFSPTNFYDRITAPIQLHQGEDDIEVPVWWSTDLYQLLKDKEKEITYYTYPGADHNLAPASLGWNTAVQRSKDFYDEYLKE